MTCIQSLKRLLLHRSSARLRSAPTSRAFSSADDDWNDAWETAWLPEDLSAKNRAPWESDVHFDPEAKAFVEEMDERWEERRRRTELNRNNNKNTGNAIEDAVATRKKRVGDEEYRLRKQKIHASLWTKEIENMDEVSCLQVQGSAEIDQLLNSCAEIFDSGNDDLNNTKIPGTSGFKTKPDGWETTSKALDGNIWEVTQREEDILLQEFERRIAFSKFQIASFIKTHIFSRRRPIDGWKYMIEEIGPNARKRKGSVRGLPSLSDPATQTFGDEQTAIGSKFVL